MINPMTINRPDKEFTVLANAEHVRNELQRGDLEWTYVVSTFNEPVPHYKIAIYDEINEFVGFWTQ